MKTFFGGRARFCVESKNQGLLNRLRQYSLTDIDVGGGKISFTCPLLHKCRIQNILRGEIHTVCTNNSIWTVLNTLWAHMTLAVFSLVAVVGFFVLDGFVFTVEVTGIEGAEHAEVMRFVAENNLIPWRRKQPEKAQEVASRITSQFDFVGHAAAKIVGNRLIFNIHRAERAGDKGINSNIVSTADGVVESVLVLSGRALVEPGAVVRKGDILIAGEYQTGSETFTPCRAVGEVRIGVQYSASAVATDVVQRTVPSGKNKTVRDVFAVGFGQKKPHNAGFKFFTEEERITEWTLFLKFVLIETTYTELVIQTQVVDPQIHKHTVAGKLLEKLWVQSGLSGFDKVENFFTDNKDGSVIVEVVAASVITIT